MRYAATSTVLLVVLVLGLSVGSSLASGERPVAHASRACSESSQFVYNLRARHTRCKTARRLAHNWAVHYDYGDCGISAQPGGTSENTCHVRAYGISFFCHATNPYAEVNSVRCRAGRRRASFRFSY